MAYVLSSVSGNLISAASAGFAPTNSADVSAIASSYQVVSATATQLNAGTAYLTSVNETPISAARAGNAANASLANSAWYDGTGRFISALPDEATVSSIASAYAESAASSKQDTLTFDWDADSAISSINGSALAGGGGAQVVTSITTGGYGVRAINGMSINASHMVLGAAAANNTSNVVRLGDENYGAGVFLSGSFGSAYYKVNELQLNRNGTGFIAFNIGGAGSQITATSNAGGKFSAGGKDGARSYYTAFNASASASIEVTGDTAMINIADTGYTSTIYPSSIPYWNAKLDASAIECDTASAITAIGGSAIAGGGASYTSPSGTIIVGADTLEGTDSGVGVTYLTSFQKSGYFNTAYGKSASGSSNYPTVFNLSGSAGTLSCRVSSNGAYYTSVSVEELNGTVVIPSGSWRLQKNHYAPMYWTAENYYSGTANVQLAHKSDVTVTSLKRTRIYDYSTNPSTTSTAVSAINGEPIQAMSALSASRSEFALYSNDGKPLSAMVTATPYSKNGTIHITGLEVEGSDSAFMPSPYVESGTVTAVPFEWDSAVSATHWTYQWNTDTSTKISRIDISGVNNYGSVFVRMGNYAGNDLSTSFYVSPYVTSVYELKTPFYVDYVYLSASSQNSASSISSVTFTAYSQDSGTVVPLAHASALPTYEYDGTAITAIDGSAIGGGGGVDSATVSAIASSYAESAASSKLDTTAQVVTATGSGTWDYDDCVSSVNGAPLYAKYAGLAYYDSALRDISQLPDTNAVSAIASSYAESATSGKVDQSAYDDLYSAFTALNNVISQYSAYFSSISAKVDNSAIGVIE